MSAMDLLAKLEALGVVLSVTPEGLKYSAPKGVLDAAMLAEIRAHKEQLRSVLGREQTAENILAEPDEEIPDLFPLSPLQQAYWVGERNLYAQRCVPYFYNEYLVKQLDIGRLENAVNRLVENHGALRLVFHDDGTQSIAEATSYRVSVIDFPDANAADMEAELAAYRGNVERRLAQNAHARPFEFAVHRFRDAHIVSFAIRLIVVDGVSFNLFLSELIDLYAGGRPAPRSSYSYYDYIRYLEARRRTPAYRRAMNYWRQRLDTLPGMPQLPYLETGSADADTQFRRLSHRLPAAAWRNLNAFAKQHGVPVNCVLCAVFCDVLARWSASADFSLTVLLSDRPVQVKGMDNLIGNCSTTLLLEVHQHAASFAERAALLRDQVFSDIEHQAVAGVELIRQLQSARHAGQQPLLPVVFTSGVGLAHGLEGFIIRHPDWDFRHSHLKTPQVWLDHQVYEDQGELVFNWDFIPSIFPSGLVEDMFDAYRKWLGLLAGDSSAWRADRRCPQIDRQLLRRRLFNSRYAPIPNLCLHDGFVRMAQTWPEKTALITADGECSYGELYRRALQVAHGIRAALPAGGNSVVGVHALKGRDQIAAVLGILFSGNTYLPLDGKLPPQRAQHLLQHSGARALLVDLACEGRLDGLDTPPVLSIETLLSPRGAVPCGIPGGRPSDRAYVLYTSGSTGQPKGVVITHESAMNTIEDMVRRFGLLPEDTVLGLSALNFDLSVYDIFATLSHGATLLLPPDLAAPDPSAWIQLMRRHPVTVWNSVPALMEITLEYVNHEDLSALAHLRLALFSGDWIPPKLIRTLKAACPQTNLVALGGATEASIWSNFYTVSTLPEGWSSVPYGTPLSNQEMHVLDERMEDRPDWVVGDLYIGGFGLAQEYLNDAEKTNASFITHPATGQRLYRAGDLARVRDGLIEFIGRKDFQVKIRGYRVELGEIEACACKAAGVESAVALMHGRGSEEQRLVLFYTASGKLPLSHDVLADHFTQRLPHYMVPSLFIFVEQMPLSANAKVDRKQLDVLIPSAGSASAIERRAPAGKTEQRLCSIWKELLHTEIDDVSTGFFQLGGNSLLTVRLANRVREEFGADLPLTSIFQNQTVSALAQAIDNGTQAHAASLLIELSGNRGMKDPLFLIHPVGGHVFCYQPLVDILTEFSVFGIQSADFHADGGPDSIEAMARAYADAVIAKAEGRPIHLGGWSMGGVLAIAVANQLERRGMAIAPLLLIDPWIADPRTSDGFDTAATVGGFLNDVLGEDVQLPPAENGESAHGYLQRCLSVDRALKQRIALSSRDFGKLFDTYLSNSLLLRRHQPTGIRAAALLAQAEEHSAGFVGLRPLGETLDAGKLHFGDVSKLELCANHWSIMQPRSLKLLADRWRDMLVRFKEPG